MPTSAASPNSDYGSEIEWDATAEAQLAALEQTSSAAAPPRSTNKEDDATTVLAVEVGRATDGQASEQDALTAARLAEALRECGVGGRVEPDTKSLCAGNASASGEAGVQHSYRLASKPHLPPLERPAAIISSTGASIPVDSTRTVKRENVLDKGKAVHAKIEREVMGPQEKVEVAVAAKEEWWALRVLNTLVCLETLLETGRVREVPVCGFVAGFLVFGVIDEIERRDIAILSPISSPPPTPAAPAPSSAAPPRPRTPSKPHKVGSNSQLAPSGTPEKDGQRKLEHFFSAVPSPKKKGKEKALHQDALLDLTEEYDDELEALRAAERSEFVEKPQPVMRSGLVLSDTKTRYNRSLPAKPESRAARLQLMLYHRLFTSLLQPEPPPDSPSPFPRNSAPPFSWSRLYAHLSLNPVAPLSPAFLASIQPVILGSALEDALDAASDLGGFVAALGRYGDLLRGGRPPELLLEPKIEISYRLRGEGGWKGRRGARDDGKQRKKGQRPAGTRPTPAEDAEKAAADEEDDLRRAIALSLEDAACATPASDAAPRVAAAPATAELAPMALDLPEAEECADTVDSQLDDSQLPFLANPSLPLRAADLLSANLLDTPSSSLTSSAQAFDLPQNSQSGLALQPAPAVDRPARPSRCNFRRRAAPDESTSAPPSSTASAASTSPPRKRPRSASPAPPRAPSSTSVEQPQSSQPTASPSSLSSASDSPSSPDKLQRDLSFIGVETFLNSPSELGEWLASVIAYWRGEREPVGVSLSEVNRCRTCEFEDGCEWRAMKAQEATQAARERRKAKEGG
ncbi:hypothetical protein JCM10213v2_008942 [Rhodosporidiobolus nylandii]